MKSKLLALGLVSWRWGLAQSPPPVVIGTSYTLPMVTAAPGQLITLVVEGITNRPPAIAPGGQDLPNSLAGITMGYASSFTFSSIQTPILAVTPYYGGCSASMFTICGQLGALTVQIPFEAQCVLCANGGVPPQFFNVVQDSVIGPRMYAEILPDQIHILTTCDTLLNPQNTASPISVTGLPPCPSVVTHADGSAVTADAPAQPKEELVAYAVGLGQTNPPLQTGKLVTAAVPTQTTFGLDFNYRPNALGTKPLPGAPPPVFAGATPGYVGLYQVNFVVPDVPPGTLSCATPSRAIGRNIVESNLTVSVGGGYSFDAVRICVATQ